MLSAYCFLQNVTFIVIFKKYFIKMLDIVPFRDYNEVTKQKKTRNATMEVLTMAKLQKIKNELFNECYEGQNGSRIVRCILDDFCVRYIVLEPGKQGMRVVSRREYDNAEKARCFKNAEKALSK